MRSSKSTPKRSRSLVPGNSFRGSFFGLELLESRNNPSSRTNEWFFGTTHRIADVAKTSGDSSQG
jgi:hypothetical protein